MELDIDIFWYECEIINDNKKGKLDKLVFVSYYEVKELVKGNLYYNLRLILNWETKLDNGIKIKNDPHILRADKIKFETSIIILKSAKVIDYEPYYLDDDVTIYSHKYTIVAQVLNIDKGPVEEIGINTYK